MSDPRRIYNYDFIKQFTLAILKVIERNRFNITQPKVIIDADIIPELSDELIREYTLNEELLRKLQEIEEIDFLEPDALPMPERLSPEKKKTVRQLGLPQMINPSIVNRTPPMPQKAALPGGGMGLQLPSDITRAGDGYELILPFIEDPAVSRIQCIGPNKPIQIIKAGQKHSTKVALTQEQIHDVLQEIAEMAHIPLIEGPVKIALESYSLDGVNARITESKFIIQKKTAYSMLERPAGGMGMPGGMGRGMPPRGPVMRR